MVGLHAGLYWCMSRLKVSKPHWVLLQAAAAAMELAIPHFTSAAIFSVAEAKSAANFHVNIRLLMVRTLVAAPSCKGEEILG